MTNKEQTSERTIHIGIAETPAQKKEVYHFRYQIYVEEMCKNLSNVDYATQSLKDKLDDWAVLICVKQGLEMIGTARINIGAMDDFPQELAQQLSLGIFQSGNAKKYQQNFALVTKIMVAPAYRSSPAMYLLIAKCYELCLSNDVQFCFGAANFHLLRLYEQIGFHRYSKNFADGGYGILSPLVMPINDVQHLRRVQSPLLRIARKKGVLMNPAVEWFYEKFIHHSHNINSQLVTEEALWSALQEFLPCPPTGAVNILRGLSVAEAKKFLHSCGIVVHCKAGDEITNQNHISYAHNILLSGRLKSLTFKRPVKEYTLPGRHFGVNGLTQHAKHTEDIMAMEDAVILVLSGMAFPRFFNSCPDIAHRIVQNMRG